MFVELVFAPGYDDDALELLQQKPNVRMLENQERRSTPVAEHDIKRVRGGMLVQDRDTGLEQRDEMQVVTERKPTEEEWGELLFAWQRRASTCARTRSCSSKDLGTVGHRRRADEPRGLGADRGREGAAAGLDLDGAVLASDAFFPFADGPQLAIDAGVRAIIQPGGSQRDHEVVEACDAAGVAMVFTARRHFRH